MTERITYFSLPVPVVPRDYADKLADALKDATNDLATVLDILSGNANEEIAKIDERLGKYKKIIRENT